MGKADFYARGSAVVPHEELMGRSLEAILSVHRGRLALWSAYIHKFFIALERAQHLIHARQILSHLRYNLSPLLELFIFKEGS